MLTVIVSVIFKMASKVLLFSLYAATSVSAFQTTALSSARLGMLQMASKHGAIRRLRGGGTETTMGVDVSTERPGDGKTFPQKGDMLTMHYHGSLAATGAKFDSSYDRGSPFKFQIGVGQVIKGWDEGVIKMSLGEKAKLTISADYGYGARGFPPVIPPASDLIFDVELLAINNQKA